jgi:hypothetical protein
MKKLIIGMALCAAAVPVLAQNVSISVGQPGFSGRLNVGDFAPRPVLYAPQPVIIEQGPRYVAEPVYLRVPSAHRAHWGRYCGRYGACGMPVLFVRDEWYTRSYVPAYHRRYGPPARFVEYGGPRWEHGYARPEFHDRGRHEGWDRGHGEWRGHGEGRGEGHGEWRGGEGRGHGDGRGEGRGEGHGHGR